MKPLPSIDRVCELLEYEATTGLFRWRVSRNAGPAACVAGNIAGTKQRRGYIVLTIDGRRVVAQRIAFLMMNGRWPAADIDHINGERSDNRWVNLREATRSQNNQNIRGPKRNNSTGFLGVKRHVRGSGVYWSAAIQVNKKPVYLGCYPSGEEAHAAYIEAKSRLHPFAPKAVYRKGAKA